MYLLANSAARAGVEAGIASLRRGDALLDVLETVLRLAESHREERSVGLGGIPNILGTVELDASLMDGRTRRTGSVAALAGFLHPVSVARQLMALLPHELLVGAGAARFAREIGAEEAELLTPESEAEWRDFLARSLPPESPLRGRIDDPAALRAAVRDDDLPLSELVRRSVEVVAKRDTAVVLVGRDTDCASGTTTSGWPFKYPGRLGDSAVIGAGHYADSRFGAAACTHTGEMAIRASSARFLVLALERGATPEAAVRMALADLQALREGLLADLVLHVVDRDGNCFAASTGVAADYYWWREGMTTPDHRSVPVL